MTTYLPSVRKQLQYYKGLGEGAMAQLSDRDLFDPPENEDNHIPILVKHLWGNMRSRWTDFLTTDGEKQWRMRDAEFKADIVDRPTLMAKWEAGWTCLFQALDGLTNADCERIIYIRNEGHTVVEAINRQLCHYSYHIGQIVYIAKKIRGTSWQSLSIPKNESDTYNRAKFERPPGRRHVTDPDVDLVSG